MFLTGVLQAFIVLLLTAVFNVYIRVGILTYDLQPILFTCITVTSASFILLIYSGPGKFGASSFKNIATWGYGFCNIIQFVLDIYLSKYVSATELSLFSRLTIPVSIVIALLMLKRKPNKMDLFGVGSIILGAIVLFYLQDLTHIKAIVILVILAAVFFSAEMFFAETHSQSVQANKIGNIKDRARVVGFASFITSVLFLVMAMTVALLKDFTNIDNAVVQALPSFKEYFHFPTVLSGVLYGATVAALARFCTWSATYKIKTENVLAILVFVPFTTYLLERLASFILNIDINSNMFSGERGTLVLIALIFMTLGSALSILPKITKNIIRKKGQTFFSALKESIKQQDNNYEIQHDEFDSSDYDILEQTLAFYDGQYKKAADLYDISEDALKAVLFAKGNNAFIESVSKKVQKIYHNEVVTRDKLTKAKNRLALSIDIRQLITKNKDFSVILLDLNDFKPVNDTYGHDAGDLALVKTVERLEKLFVNNVYRLGGDEFVLVCQDEIADDLLKKIKQSISRVIKYKEQNLKITVSLGVAVYKQNGLNQDELLDYADKHLYKDKGSKR